MRSSLCLTSLQRIKSNADAYKKLRSAALDCIEEAKFDDEAQKVFKTEAVQDSLYASAFVLILCDDEVR